MKPVFGDLLHDHPETHTYTHTHTDFTYIMNRGCDPTPYVTFGQMITGPRDPPHCEH